MGFASDANNSYYDSINSCQITY